MYYSDFVYVDIVNNFSSLLNETRNTLTILRKEFKKTNLANRTILLEEESAFSSKIENVDPFSSKGKLCTRSLRKGLTLLRKKEPINLYVLTEMHKILMQGQDHAAPGNLRSIQNWLGSPGCSIEEAVYVPPAPQKVRSMLIDLVSFLEESKLQRRDPLIISALTHGIFESIHPFNDGNGRVGRHLIQLILFEAKEIRAPIPISKFLYTNRNKYYIKLNELRDASWDSWIHFMVTGIKATATYSINKLQKLNREEEKE